MAKRRKKQKQKQNTVQVTALAISSMALASNIITILSFDKGKIYENIFNSFAFFIETVGIGYLLKSYSQKVSADAWPIYVVFFASIVIICYSEYKSRTIPNFVTLPGTIFGLVMSCFIDSIGFINSLSGCVVGGGILFIINYWFEKNKQKILMGGGVVKMQIMIGAFIGLQKGIYTLVISTLMVLIYFLYLKLLNRKLLVEVGPFLAVGAVLTTMML